MWVLPIALILGVAGAAAYLFVPRQRSPEERERLRTATARVDGELAGNLELLTMFGQTKQPAVMENSGYRQARETIAGADSRLARRLDALYELIPYAETAMETRGPAGSIKAEDLATVHNWEGGARAMQHDLRALPTTRPATPWQRLMDRITRGRAKAPAREGGGKLF